MTSKEMYNNLNVGFSYIFLRSFVLLICFWTALMSADELVGYAGPEHALNHDLFSALKECDANLTACIGNIDKITSLSAKIANEHAALLLYDRALDIFDDILYFMQNEHIIGKRAAHILSVLSFAQGRVVQAEQYWSDFEESDLASQRTLAAQATLIGAGRSMGQEHMQRYVSALNTRMASTMMICNASKYLVNSSIHDPKLWSSYSVQVEISPEINEDVKDAMIALLLSEAQGSVRPTSIRGSDLVLAASELPPLDAKMRFQLGVGLAKLGLFELSMKHVRLAATPWEDPLYSLRGMLVLAPVHTSVRSLAAAVEQFESQAELILLDEALPRSYLMQHSCSSPEEVSLILQSLPLLHLAGFSAPYHHVGPVRRGSSSGGAEESSLAFTALGYSAISLPALLSEVYQHVCPPEPVHSKSLQDARTHAVHSTTPAGALSATPLKVGVIAGSFDNIPGRIMIGLLESMSSRSRQGVRLTAMCFATPRDATTDRVNGLFDEHINLTAHNKTLIMQRIIDFGADILLFADAALDSRVFALAHERLALHQAVVWHWGGTLGIPTIDYYFMPEIFWSHSKCAVLHRGPVPPQSLFTEQVVLLEGMAYISVQSPVLPREEVRALLQTRYLLPVNNQTHIYVFPGSVKHLHPEFDRAIDVILKTDPLALIVLAVVRSGRDNVPPTHIAVRHDLMHPSQPAAAVAKCLRRLRGRVGVQNIDRVRVLPPLDEAVLRGLMQLSVAVLDPFPVGMHLPILQAMLDQIPVLSSFALQECTNSHAFNMAHFLNITSTTTNPSSSSADTHAPHAHTVSSNTDNFAPDPSNSPGASDNFQSLYPTTPEEYGVWAVRLQREPLFRQAFIARDRAAIVELMRGSRAGPHTHGEQLLSFMRTLVA